MKLTLLLVSMVTLCLSYAENEMFLMEKKGGPKRHYCGPDLRASLQLICNSIYNTLKRSSSDTLGREDWSMNFIRLEEPQMSFPFRSRTKALAVIPEYFRRQTRSGAADECCSKPCSVDELYSYCGPEKKPLASVINPQDTIL